MKHTLILTALLLSTGIFTTPANAGFLDSVNKLATAVDKLDGAAETLEGTAERLNVTAPAAGGETAEEAEILEKARQIEEQRTLDAAERIRARNAR